MSGPPRAVPLRTRPLAAVALTAALAAACSHAGPRPAAPEERRAAPPREERAVEVGLASYYARWMHGHRTASGARYDRHAMTCAHRRLPFGTLLRVTDLENGRSVVVKVTDRGPFVEDRLVDLSWAAARALGMLERGVARVRLELVKGE